MTHPDAPDKATIDRALNQDRDALEELLLLRYDWLSDVASRAVPAAFQSRIPAEDILQESFVKILRGYAQFTPQGEASLFYWLKTIVQNTAKDMLRKSSRSKEAYLADQSKSRSDESVSEFVSSLALSNDPRASVVARGQELNNAFKVALAELEPKYQQVIEILYFEQLTVEEAAKKLDITTAAVRGLRQRAREKIKDAMVRLSHFV